MKSYLAALILLINVLVSSHAHANDVDPLWNKLVGRYSAMKKYAARNIEQSIQTKEGDVVSVMSLKKEFKTWEKDKAQYAVLSITPPGEDKDKIAQAFGFAELLSNMEARLFSNQYAVVRTDTQNLNGQTLVLFEVERKGIKLKVWANEDGKIVQTKLEGAQPMMLEGFITNSYDTDANGMNLPKLAVTKISILIPFNKSEINTKEVYSNWFEHP